MPQRIRWSLALLAFALLMVGPVWASDIEPLDSVVSLGTAEMVPAPEDPAAPDIAVPSLESQLAEAALETAQAASTCPLAKCIPSEHGCPSDCICRVINCVPQCLPLPLRPDSCQ